MRRLLNVWALLLLVSCQNSNDRGESDSTVPSTQALTNTVTTQLAVDLSRTGQAVVAAATVIPDAVVLSPNITSEYAYEVVSRGKTIAAQPLPELYSERGIAKPGTLQEYQGVQETTRVLIYIPGKTTTDEDYNVIVYRLNAIPSGQAVSPGNFAAVAQANGASVFARLDGKSVSARVKQLRASGH